MRMKREGKKKKPKPKDECRWQMKDYTGRRRLHGVIFGLHAPQAFLSLLMCEKESHIFDCEKEGGAGYIKVQRHSTKALV